MPKQKQRWQPAQDIDPGFFQLPSKKSKAAVIKNLNGEVVVHRPAIASTTNGPGLPVQSGLKANDAGRIPPVSANAASNVVKPDETPAHSLVPETTSKTQSARASGKNDDPPSLDVMNQRNVLPPDEHSNAEKHASSTKLIVSQSGRYPRTSKTPPLRSNLDIYAHKYVPQWLRAVNESAAIPVSAPQLRHLDFDDYQLRSTGIEFRDHLPTLDLPPQYPCHLLAAELHSRSYDQYWQQRLQNEYAAQALQNEDFGLFNVLVPYHDSRIGSHTIKIPGIRENTPRIDLGDILYIRPLAPYQPDTSARLSEQWRQTRDGVAPGFTGREHHAVVWSVLRRNETVIVRLGADLLPGTKCNVIIPLSAHKYAPAWRAVHEVHESLKSVNIAKSWLSSMLFPETSHAMIQTTLSKGSFDLEWLDTALNFEQKRAVQAVIDAKYGRIPYLISGPPGTGKTKSIVEAVLQLLRVHDIKIAPHILVCAPSDAAADTLLTRLSAHLLPNDLFRLNNWTRQTSEVPGEVRPYCYLDETNLYTLPPFERLMATKVVVTSCRDANMLVLAGLTNRVLTKTLLRMLRAIAPTTTDSLNLLHWTALLLDEAAQATEPEALVPLSVIAPLDDRAHIFTPQVIMAGDEHQLGPRLASAATLDTSDTCDTSGLEISLFERLFSSPLYKDHPLSRSRGSLPLTKSMLPIVRPPFANLIRNYRSHPAILATSSALFYSDTLIPERPETSPAILTWPLWQKQLNSVWPVMFRQNLGPDSVESVTEGDGTGSGTLMNPTEAQLALELATKLLRHVDDDSQGVLYRKQKSDYLQPQDIIVMSPFRAQVNYLRQVFRDAGLYDVRIGPLEAFQGLESRIVILCTTRTRLGQAPHSLAKYVNEDKARNLGVVDEPKRFNVAMTRAKEALIVIGHAEALSCTGDICWLSFLKFCLRNNLCHGGQIGWIAKKDKAGRTKEDMGKLERALRYTDHTQAVNVEPIHDGPERQTTNAISSEGQQSFKFKLRGTMIDLQEEMWQMQVGDEEEDMIREEEDQRTARDLFDNRSDNDDDDDDDDDDTDSKDDVGNHTRLYEP